jgi:hypothetical protein
LSGEEELEEELELEAGMRSAQQAGRIGLPEGVDQWENNEVSLQRGFKQRIVGEEESGLLSISAASGKH